VQRRRLASADRSQPSEFLRSVGMFVLRVEQSAVAPAKTIAQSDACDSPNKLGRR
jgi:hypothetical protein